jgi:hypothetical protein
MKHRIAIISLSLVFFSCQNESVQSNSQPHALPIAAIYMAYSVDKIGAIMGSLIAFAGAVKIVSEDQESVVLRFDNPSSKDRFEEMLANALAVNRTNDTDEDNDLEGGIVHEHEAEGVDPLPSITDILEGEPAPRDDKHVAAELERLANDLAAIKDFSDVSPDGEVLDAVNVTIDLIDDLRLDADVDEEKQNELSKLREKLVTIGELVINALDRKRNKTFTGDKKIIGDFYDRFRK